MMVNLSVKTSVSLYTNWKNASERSIIQNISKDNSTVLHLENVYSGPTPPFDLQNGGQDFSWWYITVSKEF